MGLWFLATAKVLQLALYNCFHLVCALLAAPKKKNSKIGVRCSCTQRQVPAKLPSNCQEFSQGVRPVGSTQSKPRLMADTRLALVRLSQLPSGFALSCLSACNPEKANQPDPKPKPKPKPKSKSKACPKGKPGKDDKPLRQSKFSLPSFRLFWVCGFLATAKVLQLALYNCFHLVCALLAAPKKEKFKNRSAL